MRSWPTPFVVPRAPARIHVIAQEFRLDDVWELPTPGRAEDFPRLLTQMVLR